MHGTAQKVLELPSTQLYLSLMCYGCIAGKLLYCASCLLDLHLLFGVHAAPSRKRSRSEHAEPVDEDLGDADTSDEDDSDVQPASSTGKLACAHWTFE